METAKKCENHCPRCNSENIFWDVLEHTGAVIYQPAKCNSCGCQFKEYYAYSDTEITE